MTSPMHSEENFTQRETQKESSKRKIPSYLQKMNSADRAANDKVIQSMQKKINYLKNPRFRISRPPVSFQQDATTFANDPKDSFRVTPDVITFVDYNVNCIYEIPLTLTNASSVLKRVKHMPPATPEFSVPRVKYPSETGIIAPGMSAVFYINFMANSLSDFDDELLIVTEESSFKVKLQAKREHPVLTLPEVLDCQGCWVGDRADMAFNFTNKAGEASYKFFCENEEDDKLQTGDVLRLENFTVYPAEFSIAKGQKIDLYVCFTPKREGLIEEKVILACDNNTSKVYTLKAVANMAEFRVTKINGNAFENDEEFKNFYMTQVQPKFPKSSVLTIKNDTFVKVNYHWKIENEKDHQVEDEQKARYMIEPEKGVFEPNAEKDFKITFESDVSMPFYKNISLVIDDVPIEAIRNPPEIIKKQHMEHQASDDDAKKIRPSLTYFEFSIISETLFNKVEVSPPAYIFPAAVPINRDHAYKFSLKNLSQGPVGYKVKAHSKTSDFVSCQVRNNQGVIPGKGEIELETIISSDRPAVNQKCVFIVELENCDPIAFQIAATFIGPKIRLKQAAINFGLVRTHSSSSFQLEIENISEIPAEILLRRQGEDVTFDDYKEEEPYYQWWDNLVYFEPQHLTLSANETQKVNVTLNSKASATIKDIVEILTLNSQPEYVFVTAEVQEVYVTLNRFSLSFPELFTGKFYEIGNENEQSIVLSNYGNIETTFEWPDIQDTDLEAVFEPKTGVIPPKSEIPITLKMIPHIGKTYNKLIECKVNGLDGPMGFELNAKVTGLNITYELYEEESVMTTGRPKKKVGLAESLSSLQAKNGETRSLAHTTISAITKQQAEIMKARPSFSKVELMDLIITEPRTIKFVLKNISGLNTSFKLYSENFDPKAHKIDSLADIREQLESHQTFGSSSTEQRKKLAALSPNKLGGTKKKLGSTFNKTNYPLLNAAIEKVQNFTSADGKALNHARRLEKDQKFYLGNNKGIAVVCEPHEGELKAYQEIIVSMTIYNDTCGRFEDNLWSEIKGLQPIKFPIEMKISGSPLVVTPNQVGVNYKAEYPTLNLEARMHSLGVYKRQLKLTNTSPTDMNLSWKMYNLSGPSPNTTDYFNLKFGEPSIGSKDLIRVEWSAIPPPEATEGPFRISPQTAKLKPRCTETFTITFSSSVVSKYDAVALCESELIREVDELQKGSTKPNSLPVYLKATTISPFLTLDKMKRMDGTHVIKLEKWALIQAKKQRRPVILRNHTPAHLDFTVQIDGPFRILELKTSSLESYEILPQSKEGTRSESRVSLRPESFLELLVEFQGYNEKDHEKWPLCPIMRVPGLIHVNYANGDYQSFELEGGMYRPVLEINTAGFEGKPVEDILDFGVNHIHNTVQKTVYLANISKVPAKWRLNYVKFPAKKILGLATVTKMDMEDAKKTDDPEVFEFSLSEGTVGGRTIPVNKVPEGKTFEGYMTKQFNGVPPPSLYGTGGFGGSMSSSMLKHSEVPMKVMINFKPKMNILYKSKYRITIDEGPSIDVILRGMGTYEEKFEK